MNRRTPHFAFSAALLLALSGALASGCGESHTAPELTDSGMGGLDAPIPPGVDGGPVTGVDGGPVTGVDGGPVTGVDGGPVTGVDGGPVTGVDGGPITVVDGGPVTTVDAGPPGVTCGTETCVDPDICCVTFSGGGPGGGMPMFACTAAGACMGSPVACDGPEDCASGEACCGMRTMGGGAASCVPDMDCGFGRLCHADGDCRGTDTCCSFMGVSVCSPFCP